MIAYLLCSPLVTVGLSHAPTDLFKYHFFLESAECVHRVLLRHQFCSTRTSWCRLVLHFTHLATLCTCPCSHFLFLPTEFCKSGLALSSVLCEGSYEWSSLSPSRVLAQTSKLLWGLSHCSDFCPDNWSVNLILSVMVVGKSVWLKWGFQKCQ